MITDGGARDATVSATVTRYREVVAAIRATTDATVWLQLREKDLDSARILELAKAMVETCAGFDVRVLINDRIDVAVLSGADGVHLPESGVSITDARSILSAGKLVAVSCHSIQGVKAAATAGADAVVFGPVFATPSKRAFGQPQGLSALRDAVAAANDVAVLGLGGVESAAQFAAVRAAGAQGVAGIRVFATAPSARTISEALAG